MHEIHKEYVIETITKGTRYEGSKIYRWYIHGDLLLYTKNILIWRVVLSNLSLKIFSKLTNSYNMKDLDESDYKLLHLPHLDLSFFFVAWFKFW